MANDSSQTKKSATSGWGRSARILEISIHILSFVNTLANSCEANEAMLGRNATSGFLTIIERSRRSCRIILRRWSHFS